MPTTQIKTIKPGGGGDYLSLSAWELAERADLVSGDLIKVAEVYGGGNANASGNGELDIVSASWTTDADHYILVRAAPGEGHEGFWDTGKAYWESATQYGTDFEKDVRLVGMQVRAKLGTVYAAPTSAQTVLVQNCLLSRLDTSVDNRDVVRHNGTGTVDVVNCVLITPTDVDSVGIRKASSGIIHAYFNTIRIHTGVGLLGTITSQNNYISAGTGCYSSGASSGSNDATANAEAATAGLRNIPYGTATFLDVTAGAEDLHIPAGSALKYAGVAIVGITVDFDGDTRPDPPSIGADDVVVPVVVVPVVASQPRARPRILPPLPPPPPPMKEIQRPAPTKIPVQRLKETSTASKVKVTQPRLAPKKFGPSRGLFGGKK